MMLTSLIDYINKFVKLTPDEIDIIHQQVVVKTFEKGAILLKEGEIAKSFFFNLEGCVRIYYLVDGTEKTVFFYSEHQFITVYESFIKGLPSKFYIECLESTTLAVFSYENEMKLLEQIPKLELLARLVMEEELSIYQEIIASLITLSPQERYNKLIKKDPKLVQRIPQYYLATYLGITPESLSRIRKRIKEKDRS
jgi:CRP-like cAMP-binding protein